MPAINFSVWEETGFLNHPREFVFWCHEQVTDLTMNSEFRFVNSHDFFSPIRTSYVCQVVVTKTVFKTPCKKWFPQQESFTVKFSKIYFPLQIFRTLSVHSTRSKIKEFAYTSIKHTMRKKTVLSAVICSLNRQPWDASESLEWIPLDALKKRALPVHLVAVYLLLHLSKVRSL